MLSINPLRTHYLVVKAELLHMPFLAAYQHIIALLLFVRIEEVDLEIDCQQPIDLKSISIRNNQIRLVQSY
jgi:hypothetical protein